MIAANRFMNLPPVAESARVSDDLADRRGDGETEVAPLVERARRGDAAAFAGVVALFEKRVFHFALRMLGNPHDAEDVTQETFVKAWHSLPRYRARHRFCAWLFTIARRSALNHLRSRKPMEELKDHDAPLEEPARDAAADRDDARNLWALARRLPPEQYEALRLCYAEGFSIQETARVMETNVIRTRVLLHRARRRLAGWLKS